MTYDETSSMAATLLLSGLVALFTFAIVCYPIIYILNEKFSFFIEITINKHHNTLLIYLQDVFHTMLTYMRFLLTPCKIR